jgi:hypothetical protein
MLEQPTMETGLEFELPWELSQWAKPRELRAWVDEIVGALDWGNPELRQWERANPDVQPRVVLAVLTLAYSLGRYDAEEIENACFKEPIFLELCENRWQPRATQLNHFRKQNRGLLKYCLFELFKRAFKARFQMGDAFIPAGIRKHLLESSVARLDMARQMSRGPDNL